MYRARLAFSVIVALMCTTCVVFAQTAEITKKATAAVDWTPMLVNVPQAPRLFQGSDNKYNLVYELFLQNYSRSPIAMLRCEILDGKSGKLIKTLGPTEFPTTMRPVTGLGSTIGAGEAADVFINLEFDAKGDAPAELKHRVVYSTLDGLNRTVEFVQECCQTPLDTLAPVAIGPPLKGGRWIVAGGYSSHMGHRDALFSVGNKLVNGQRYAIDWLRLDDENYSNRQPTANPQSSAAFGKPVIAVSDGLIVGTVDKFPDQESGASKEPERYAYPGGNYIVEDIGGGNFAFYAHLHPGSISVKTGDKVKRGQTIAALGNSGNTTGPHLHFHVMRGPSCLGDPGVPYEIDKFEIVGQIADLNAFIADEEKGLPHKIVPSPFNGMHNAELPKEAVVIKFAD